ncbi:hypothetical protein O9G_000835 [Rozella allomycis CSF55]|uniref:NUDE domain-containing protein n=1 Tax=Rozella allomycis (strain CSF55) TaxID=988480 RepID=A0A075ARF4_ROZAC|nr:hypothetical protein O9G_000835 [Rozella allomycis CSF55]|eukprot:EPZ32760.1 hypothetical protein O9G_000835 [Rozella allomycis CSF55]
MQCDDIPEFCPSEGNVIEFYKINYPKLIQRLKEVQESFDEFQSSSKEYEHELERELESLESRNKELLLKVQQLSRNEEMLRARLANTIQEQHESSDQLQDELLKLKENLKARNAEIINLENENEELENRNRYLKNYHKQIRILESTVLDYKTKYQNLLENTILTEAELEKKAQLEIDVQRLKDELDLSTELSVAQRDKQKVAPSSPIDLTTFDENTSIDMLSEINRRVKVNYRNACFIASRIKAFIMPVKNWSDYGQEKVVL